MSTREGFSCSLHFIMDNSNVGKKNILAWKTAFHREMICLNIIDRQPFSWHWKTLKSQVIDCHPMYWCCSVVFLATFLPIALFSLKTRSPEHSLVQRFPSCSSQGPYCQDLLPKWMQKLLVTRRLVAMSSVVIWYYSQMWKFRATFEVWETKK